MDLDLCCAPRLIQVYFYRGLPNSEVAGPHRRSLAGSCPRDQRNAASPRLVRVTKELLIQIADIHQTDVSFISVAAQLRIRLRGHEFCGRDEEFTFGRFHEDFGR